MSGTTEKNRKQASASATARHRLATTKWSSLLNTRLFIYNVPNIETRMITRKGWIDHIFCVALNVEQDEASVTGMEAINVQGFAGLGATRTMCEFIKVAVYKSVCVGGDAYFC